MDSSRMKKHTKEFSEVYFSVYCETSFGENVFITGNSTELGNWSPRNGVKLETDKQEYPIWYCKETVLLKTYFDFEFKICVVSEDGKNVRWENLLGNRHICLNENCSIFLTANEEEVQYETNCQDDKSTQVGSSKKGYSQTILEVDQIDSDEEEVRKQVQSKVEIQQSCD